MIIQISDAMGDDEEKEIESEKITGGELLKKLGISTFEATIMKNGNIVLESEILTSKDKIKILKMIHGG
jgi:sulfur carrier protein ThiS